MPNSRTMKRIFYTYSVLTLFGLVACNEHINTESSDKKSTAPFTPLSHSYEKTDTLRFSKDSTKMVVTGVMKLVTQKDSSKLAPIDVLFYKNGNQLAAYSTELKVDGGEDISHYFEATDSLGQSCEQFFTAIYGVQACGYLQHNLTFSVDDKGIYLLTKHESIADGAYGSGIMFYGMCTEPTSKQVSSVDVSNEPSERDENIVNLSYKDSTVYTFNGKSWETKRITEKDKIYRTAQENF